MDEAFKSPSAGVDDNQLDKSQESKKRFWRSFSRKKAAAIVTSAAIAGGAVAGVEQNKSPEPAVKGDVPYQKYGQDGYPKPHVTFLNSFDPNVDKVVTIPSDNPYEYAQQMLYIAANTDPLKVTLNHIAYGLTVVFPPGTKLYHAAIGSKKFMPAKPNPNNDGKADPLVVPPNEYLVWENPRSIAIAPDEQVYYAGNKANDTNTANRATDINQNYLISVPDVQKDKVEYLSRNGEPVQLYDGIVDAQGNLKLGDISSKKLSVFETVTKDELGKMKTQRVLLPTMNPPSAGR